MKRIFFKVFLIIFGICLGLIFAEIALRIFNPQQTASSLQPAGKFNCWQKGSYYWADLKKNANCILHSNLNEFEDLAISTNSLGLRNKEITEKQAGDKRILFLGDSFTFGWGVKEKDSYPRLAETYLKGEFPNIEVINAGRPNSELGYDYLFLTKEGLNIDPDIVVIGFDLYNDLINIGLNTNWEGVDKNGLPLKISNKLIYIDSNGNQRYVNPPAYLAIPIIRDSHLFALLSDKIFSSDSSFALRFLNLNDPETLAKIRLLFKTMQQNLEQKNIKLLVVIIPDQSTVEAGSTIPLSSLEKYFSFFFERNKIDYINLQPVLAKSPQKNDLYFKNDGHWNVLGHQQAARIISQKISEMLNQP